MQKVVDLMARYIDADLLIEELKELQGLHSPSMSKIANEAIDLGLSLAMRKTRKAPNADVLEVVRCRNCKRCLEKRTKRNKQLMRFCMRMDGNEYQVNANDFCSYGKRRTDNDL
jgi:hypothetical protein